MVIVGAVSTTFTVLVTSYALFPESSVKLYVTVYEPSAVVITSLAVTISLVISP